MLFHELAGRQLLEHGITDIFGVLGDGNMWIIDSFHRNGGRYHAMANESGAVLSAGGYARVSEALGVATVTHGPALTNTVTALIENVRGGVPLLLIAGDVAAADRDHAQKLAQREVVTVTGAWFEQVRTPETWSEDLARAIRIALSESRPVVLNVPADFQDTQVQPRPALRIQIAQDQAVQPDPLVLDMAAGLIASAARPIVLGGRGASSPAARAALTTLSERIGAPLATTLLGHDGFRGHPHDLGIFGTLSNDVASDVIGKADVIIAFGASVNRYTTAEGSLLEGKALVHVDIDRANIGRHSPAAVAIVGDAATVAERLVDLLDEGEISRGQFASPELAERLARREPGGHRDTSTESTVDPRTAMVHIDEAFPRARTVVRDAGRALYGAFSLLHVEEPRAFLATIQFGSIGLGMATAIGAGIAAPERPTLLVCGDGAFMLGGLAEFNSAVRNGVDLVVVVLNDGAYGAEHVHFVERGLDPAISCFDWPELSHVAEALGGRGIRVQNLAELDRALESLAERDRPVLIDVKVDPVLVENVLH